MGPVDMPRAGRGRLIGVEPHVHGVRHAAEQTGHVHVAGRVVDGVAAEHQQRVDRAGVDGRGQLAQRPAVGDGRLGQFAVQDGLPGVAEGIVDQVHEVLDLGRLLRAGHQHAMTAMGLQVRHRRVEHRLQATGDHARLAGQGGGIGVAEDLARDVRGHCGDVVGSHRHPLVGLRADGGEVGLEGVEPRGGILGRTVAATDGEPGDVAHAIRLAGAEEVGVEHHHHVGPGQAEFTPPRAPEGQRQAADQTVIVQRLVLVPHRLGEPAGEPLLHEHDARRHRRLAQHPQAAPVTEFLGPGPSPRDEGRPGGRFATAGHATRAVRVVEVQHRRLREVVGRAEGARVRGVALDLDRPALIALHEHAGAHAADLQHAGVLHRHAGDPLGRAEGRGDDLLGGPPAATGQAHARKGEGRPHDAEELTAIGAVEHLRSAGGELTVHPLAELDRLSEFVEAAERSPAAGSGRTVRRGQRWHVEQSSPGLIWLSSFHQDW